MDHSNECLDHLRNIDIETVCVIINGDHPNVDMPVRVHCEMVEK